VNLPGTMQIDANGHLQIGQCDVIQLANTYGTPLYILDEMALRQKCREYHRAFREFYPDYQILYASKAFSTMAICRLMEQEGLGLDVVSGGELFTALAADFPPENICFHGNNKSVEELNFALASGIGRIVVDNAWELEILAKLAEGKKSKANILLRITPGIEAHTHHYIQTGQTDSKFGISLDDGTALTVVERALQLPQISLLGIHCHIGSQIFNLDSFVLAAQRMLKFMAEVKKHTKHQLLELNMGGGLGIKYTENDTPVTCTEYVQRLAQAIREYCRDYNLLLPKLLIEPGRSLVGDVGTAVYQVGAIKEIRGVRTYASVDGGMSDNLRPALYEAEYKAIVANKAKLPAVKNYTIAGKCCESGDILIRDISLPSLAPGDLLAVLSSGAYQYSMANNYNRLPRPAVILVGNGQAHLIIRRETYQDLIRCDQIPNGWGKKKVTSFVV
jgi:diaminopimelate decarboxylase